MSPQLSGTNGSGVVKNLKSNIATLCYIENDYSYLMMHRVKKEKEIPKSAVSDGEMP
jgi:hypothetical protein